jgi:hypothetical protein
VHGASWLALSPRAAAEVVQYLRKARREICMETLLPSVLSVNSGRCFSSAENLWD